VWGRAGARGASMRPTPRAPARCPERRKPRGATLRAAAHRSRAGLSRGPRRSRRGAGRGGPGRVRCKRYSGRADLVQRGGCGGGRHRLAKHAAPGSAKSRHGSLACRAGPLPPSVSGCGARRAAWARVLLAQTCRPRPDRSSQRRCRYRTDPQCAERAADPHKSDQRCALLPAGGGGATCSACGGSVSHSPRADLQHTAVQICMYRILITSGTFAVPC
jgi:hypothetical protein